MRGNVVDMAVGIIIGGAFGKIVSSVVADLFMPVLGLFVGGVNFSDLSLTLKKAVVENGREIEPAVVLAYGNFVQVVFDFVIIAFCIFLLIKAINKRLCPRKKRRLRRRIPLRLPTSYCFRRYVIFLKSRTLKRPNNMCCSQIEGLRSPFYCMPLKPI